MTLIILDYAEIDPTEQISKDLTTNNLCNQWLRDQVIGLLIGQQIFNILASTDSPVFIPNSLTPNLILTF